MWRTTFAADYIGLDNTAATHVTSNTNIKLVGIDYLSIAMMEDIEETHKILFRKVALQYGKPVYC
jgi:kynurenine formamidase